MTIDEIIEELEESKGYPASDPASDEALDGAIAIIHKYQKIEQIMKKRYGKYHIEIVQEIREVLEDGNDV
jgi:uncharacterized protein YfbU (UPF0304 family)